MSSNTINGGQCCAPLAAVRQTGRGVRRVAGRPVRSSPARAGEGQAGRRVSAVGAGARGRHVRGGREMHGRLDLLTSVVDVREGARRAQGQSAQCERRDRNSSCVLAMRVGRSFLVIDVRGACDQEAATQL